MNSTVHLFAFVKNYIMVSTLNKVLYCVLHFEYSGSVSHDVLQLLVSSPGQEGLQCFVLCCGLPNS